MFRSGKTVLAAVFAFAFMMVISSAWGAAPVSGPAVGIVDVGRVMTDAPRMKQLAEELQAVWKSMSTKLDIRAQNLMLNDAEIKELIDLKIKAQPTDADKSRIKALGDLERTRDARLKQLQGTVELKAQEKAELKDLQDTLKKSQDAGKALSSSYSTVLQNKQQELRTKASSEMKAVINQLTIAKGLSLVLSKQIEMPDGTPVESVLFGGVDITDEVIGKLVTVHSS